MKKKKRIKKRNGIAKALESPTHRQKVIQDKRRKIIDEILNHHGFPWDL